MHFIVLLLILLFPTFSFAASDEELVTYNAHGVQKQNTKNPYYHKKGFHFESQDGQFSTNLQWRAQLRFHKGIRSDPRDDSDFSPDAINNFEARRLRMKIGGHGYGVVKYLSLIHI